jgi:hypothetical protein
VFRRRRDRADRPGPDSSTTQDEPEFYDDLDELEEDEGYDDDELDGDLEPDDDGLVARGPEQGRATDQANAGPGPWDGAKSFPQRERLDFGSLLIPVREGIEVQVNMAEEIGVCVTVIHGENAMQLQAFAAPKTSGLWGEVRQEIAEEVAKSGGDSQEAQGPFGAELLARVSSGGEGLGQQLLPLRFMGVDGPRWFLRGMISGQAAQRPDLARPFEELFADVVVVRGDHPAPPRDLLEIRLPEEARRALQEQLEQQAGGPVYPDPFERGPEITETR